MVQFEIQDDKGVLFSGSPVEVMKIWDSLTAYKKNKVSEFEKTKHLIPFDKWQGNLKIVSVLIELECRPGIHKIHPAQLQQSL